MYSATSSSISFPRILLTAVLFLALAGPTAFAQDFADQLWTDVAEAAALSGAQRQIVPDAYRTVRLDQAAMASLLAEAPLEVTPFGTQNGVVLPLPTPEGGFASFRVVEAPIMAAGLQERYPQIRTYLGRGIDARGTMVRISTTPSGFRAMVLGTGGTLLVDPLQEGDTEHYMVYRKREYTPDQARVLEAFLDEQVLDDGHDEPVDVHEARP